MKGGAKLNDDKLQAEAQRLLKEALETGSMTLKNGLKMPLDAKSQIALVLQVVSKAPPRPKIVTSIEDLPINPTEGSEGAGKATEDF